MRLDERDPAGRDRQRGRAPAGRIGAGEAAPGDPPADVRLTALSDVVLELADDLGAFPRAWLSGRVKVHASMRDLLRLRKLL